MRAGKSKEPEANAPEEAESSPGLFERDERMEGSGETPVEEIDQQERAFDKENEEGQKDIESSPDGSDTAAPVEDEPEKELTTPQNGANAKNSRLFIAKYKKAIIGGSIITASVVVALLVNYLAIPYMTYLDAKSKFDNGEYTAAVESFEKITGFLDSDELKSTAEKANSYALGAKALDKKDYGTAIDYFTAAGDFEDASERLEEAKTLETYTNAEGALKNGQYELAGTSYITILDYKDSEERAAECADNLMKSADYSKAKKLYDRLGSGYKEQSARAKTAIDNQESMQAAEEKISDGDFAGALELYNKVPDDFSSSGKKAGDRKQQLNKAIEASNAAGTFSATNANFKVTQTHRSTGNWYYWTNDDTSGARVTVKATMADDGTVTLNGQVTYLRYTNYSSISSALKYRRITEEFTCGTNPGTIQLDSDTSLSYDGSWHLRFKQVDESQDVYFYYTYEASFDYSK